MVNTVNVVIMVSSDNVVIMVNTVNVVIMVKHCRCSNYGKTLSM